MRVKTLALAVCSASLALAAAPALAQRPFPSMAPSAEEGDVKVGSLTRYHVRDNVYMYSGAAGNTMVFTGKDGVLVVDPPGAPATAELIADVKALTPKPIRWVINTSSDPERSAGNKEVAAAGVPLEGGNTRPAGAAYSGGGAHVWAHEQVLNRLSAAGGDPLGWPTDTYFVAQKDLYFNGEAVQLLSAPNAHAAGDSLVFLRRSDVVASGDVYSPDRYPKLEVENGGSIQGVLDGLNQLIRLAVVQYNEEGGTLIVPAHGRIADEGDLADYRDMVTIIRDRVRAGVRKHMTLAQIQATKPTQDYDPNFGAQEGARFVEAIYRSLTAPPPKAGAETQSGDSARER